MDGILSEEKRSVGKDKKIVTVNPKHWQFCICLIRKQNGFQMDNEVFG